MPPPSLTAAPTAPSRGDAPTVFRTRADAFVAWIVTFVSEVGTLATWMDTRASEAETAQTAAEDAQTAAEAAEANAVVARNAAQAAELEAEDAEANALTYASAAQAAAGLPAFAGNAGKPLLVNSGETAAAWGGTIKLDGVEDETTALSGTTPTLTVSDGGDFSLTTSGNTTIAVSGAPSGAWVTTLVVTFGGAHTLAITGANWGDQGAPVAASGDVLEITLRGVGATFRASVTWKDSA